jgi:hypothetical protein
MRNAGQSVWFQNPEFFDAGRKPPAAGGHGKMPSSEILAADPTTAIENPAAGRFQQYVFPTGRR